MTAAEYIAAAVARSYRNRGEVLAADVPEVLARLSRQFRHYYALAAGLEAAALTRLSAMAWSAVNLNWPLPTDVDTVHHLEQGGRPVYVVPFSDRMDAEPSEPCVYRVGRAIYPAGNSTDPTAVAMRVLYTPTPSDFAAVGDSPGSEWPLNFDPMVVVDLALWYAQKDGRADDVAAFGAELQEWRGLWEEWCGRNTVPTIKRFGMPTQVPSSTVTSIGVRRG